MKFLLPIFLVLQSLAAQAQLVTVSSSYPNQLSAGSTVLVKGSGFIVEHKGRFFVFTASHVSQGENLEIRLEDLKLEPIGRKVSEVNDAELIEVRGPLKSDYEVKNGSIVARGHLPLRRRWIDAENFVPLMDWIEDPNLQDDNQAAKTLSPQLKMDLFGITLHAPLFVQPGTSGSPLVVTVNAKPSGQTFDYREWFDKASIGVAYVRGMAIRRERFFANSSFVPTNSLLQVLINYLGNKGSPQKTKWYANGTILYRQMIETGMRETYVSSSSATGGITTPIGNAVGMDGGDLKSSREDSPKEFLTNVSSFPSLDGVPAISWMLVQRSPVNNQMISFFAWFDMESYPFLSRFQLRLGGPNSGDLISRIGKEKPDFEKDGFSVSFAGEFHRIKIKLPGDSMEILLNKKGEQCESESNCSTTGFQPIAETTSLQKRESYIVDLRSLFFLDMSTAPSAAFRNWNSGAAEENLSKWFHDNLFRETNHVQIRFRKKAGVVRALRNEEAKATVLGWPKE